MPLKKLPHQGPPTTDAQMTKRRQLQERRRTLQTISELSATETPLPISRSSIGLGVRSPPSLRQTSNVGKRRSMPQYCSRPECIETRSSPPVPSKHIMTAQRGQRDSNLNSPPQIEAGWNARRERARMQAELALSGTHAKGGPSVLSLQNGYPPLKASLTTSLNKKQSQPYLKSYYSQQHFLRNSPSLTSTSTHADQRSNSGRSLRQNGYGNQDIEISGRASTDSSSYRSSHDSTRQRSRSSSSSQSFSSQDVPPLPSGAQPTRYYAAVNSYYHNGYPIQLPGPMYAKPPSEMRTTSLPYNNQHDSAYKSRPKSLSARSTPSHHKSHDKTTFRSSLPSRRARQSNHKHSTNPSLSSHPVFPPQPTPIPRERSSSLKQAPAPQPALTPDTARALPTREALTKWQSEREEAKADIGVLQRARMKERVKRANEMEREKEKELQAVGLGAEKGARVLGVGLEVDTTTSKKKGGKTGCFAGVFGRRRRRWWWWS